MQFLSWDAPRVLSSSHILIKSSLSIFSIAYQCEHMGPSCSSHKVSLLFWGLFSRGARRNLVFIQDTQTHHTIPLFHVRFVWLCFLWLSKSVVFLMLGWAVCMLKNMQHNQFSKMGGDLQWTLLESALLHTNAVQEPCNLQRIIRKTVSYPSIRVLLMINL